MTKAKMRALLPCGILAAALAAAAGAVSAQPIERVKPGDAALDCAGIGRESQAVDGVAAAGDPEAGGLAKTAAGTAANVGGQVAGATVAQSVGGLFGALGSVVSKAAGVVAQQAAETQLQPDEAAQARAAEAKARKAFLTQLAAAKECAAEGAGKALSDQQFQELAARAEQPQAPLTPLTAASVQAGLAAPVTPLAAGDLFDGKLDLKGKRFYVAEFRVLFDVGGEVSASTRGGYLPGRDYGSTRSKVNYSVPAIDVAAFQAITDKAWADLKARLAAAGAAFEDGDAFVRANGAVYETSEEASKPGAPVFLEKSVGHSGRKYLVMAPTGMKLHARGFAGLGAGDMGKRMDWIKSNLEGLSISVAVNIAALESSGSGSTLLRGAYNTHAAAGEGMAISMAPDAALVHAHANTVGLRLTQPLAVAGGFASFRTVGGYDSDKDAVGRTMGLLTNMAGMGANKSKRVDMEVDLDGPAMGRLALQGLATINQAIADRIRAGS